MKSEYIESPHVVAKKVLLLQPEHPLIALKVEKHGSSYVTYEITFKEREDSYKKTLYLDPLYSSQEGIVHAQTLAVLSQTYPWYFELLEKQAMLKDFSPQKTYVYEVLGSSWDCYFPADKKRFLQSLSDAMKIEIYTKLFLIPAFGKYMKEYIAGCLGYSSVIIPLWNVFVTQHSLLASFVQNSIIESKNRFRDTAKEESIIYIS